MDSWVLLLPISICISIWVVYLDLISLHQVEWLEWSFSMSCLIFILIIHLWFLTQLELMIVLPLRDATNFYFGWSHFIQHCVLSLLLYHYVSHLFKGVQILLLLMLLILIRSIIQEDIVSMFYSLIRPKLLSLPCELKCEILISCIIFRPVLALWYLNDMHTFISNILIFKLLMVSRLLLVILIIVLQSEPWWRFLMSLSISAVGMTIMLL
jgi:hypothetical protein